MNSTGRWVHDMTKSWHWLQSQKHCLKREASDRAISHSEMQWTKKKSAYFGTSPPRSMWFPDSSPGPGKKRFLVGGRVSQFSVLHNNQIPHACAEETSWRRFWSSSCTGIFSHPNGSVGEPWDWTCPQTPCCSEGRRTASLLSSKKWERRHCQQLYTDISESK